MAELQAVATAIAGRPVHPEQPQALINAAYCSSVKGTTDNLPIFTSGDCANSLFPLICSSKTASRNAFPALILTCGFLGSFTTTATTVAVPTALLRSPVS